MGSGRSGLYGGGIPAESCNLAGASWVGQVNKVTVVGSVRELEKTGTPNSISQVRKKDTVVSERYYDETGNVHGDIDYTNHGNPKWHPIVPHQHLWKPDSSGILHRGDAEAIT